MVAILAGAVLVAVSSGDVFHVSTRNTALSFAAQAALAGASERLARPECAAILSEYSDARGHRLQDNLEAHATSAPRYLGLLVLYDGQSQVRCQRGPSLAVTHVGSRVVWLCPQFVLEHHRDPGWAEATLIHEALHSLGLGENPPTPAEISTRIVQRCGR